MNFKKFKMFFASLAVFCTCCLFSQNKSFAFYPKEDEWNRIIENSVQVQKVMNASKGYLEIKDVRYRQGEICSNIRTLTYFIKENYPEMSYKRCEAIARFKLLEPYLYLYLDNYDLNIFGYLIEKSDKEDEVIDKLGCEILRNWDAITCDDFVKYLAYDICTLHTTVININY